MKPTKFRHKSRLWEVNSAVPCVGQGPGTGCKSIFFWQSHATLWLGTCLIMYSTRKLWFLGNAGLWGNWPRGHHGLSEPGLSREIQRFLDLQHSWGHRTCGDTTGFFVLLDHWTPSTPMETYVPCLPAQSTWFYFGNLVVKQPISCHLLWSNNSITSRLPQKSEKSWTFRSPSSPSSKTFTKKTCCFTNQKCFTSAWLNQRVFNPSNLRPEIRTSGLTGLRLCSLFWRIGCTRPRCASWIVQVFRNWGGWMRSCIWWLGFPKKDTKKERCGER